MQEISNLKQTDFHIENFATLIHHQLVSTSFELLILEWCIYRVYQEFRVSLVKWSKTIILKKFLTTFGVSNIFWRQNQVKIT